MKLIDKGIILLLVLAGMLFPGSQLSAQRTLIDVKIDSAAILVGEQTLLHVAVTADKDKKVMTLIPRDTLMTGVEVLKLSTPDTTEIDNDRLLIKQDVLVTSFDSALYLLPPLKVVDGQDTAYSNQVALKVTTIPVNVDKPEEFFDIKNVWTPPFVLADYYPWIFGILIAALLICLIGYIIQRVRHHKSILPIKEDEPKLPPYEQAIKELDEIRDAKIWQRGLNKEYFTALTETLRQYIVGRFEVGAMEMTSAEILDEVRSIEEVKPVYDRLKQILELSDFVKFAKFHPLPDENELSLTNAYLFVNETKQEEPEEEVPSQQEVADAAGETTDKPAQTASEKEIEG